MIDCLKHEEGEYCLICVRFLGSAQCWLSYLLYLNQTIQNKFTSKAEAFNCHILKTDLKRYKPNLQYASFVIRAPVCRCRGAFNATLNVEVHEGQSSPTVGEENEKQLLCKDIIHVIDEFKLVLSVNLFLSFLSTSSILMSYTRLV